MQDNLSRSKPAYTLRGLHFQAPTRGQDKLVRCIHGRIFEVALDVPEKSWTYAQWVGCELSAENRSQLYILVGFAQGFLTLEPDCEVVCQCSNTCASDHDGDIARDSVGIDWPLQADKIPEHSPKDRRQPALALFENRFPYGGSSLAPLT